MADPIFPAFIKLEKGNSEPAKSAFLSDVESILSQANGKVSAFGETAKRNLDKAFSLSATSAGGFNLDVPGMREAAAMMTRRAEVASKLADATLMAATAEGKFTQETRMAISAAKALAAEQERAAATARLEADAVAMLQSELDKQAIASGRAAAANDNAGNVSRAFRAGTQQLGYQISDLGVQLGMAAGSANVSKMAFMGFGQQLPQIVQAITLMRGEATGLVGFLGGPWGAALMASVSILGSMAIAHQDAAEASGTHKDAAEDLTKALNDLHGATVRESRSTQASIQGDIDKANALRQRAIEARKVAIAHLELTKANLSATKNGVFSGQGGPGIAIAGAQYQNQIGDLEAQIAAQNAQISKAEETVRLKRGAQIRQSVSETLDPSAAATGRYERTLDRLNSQLQRGAITEGAYRAELLKATTARDAATESAKRSERSHDRHTKKVSESTKAAEVQSRAWRDGLKSIEALNKELVKGLGGRLDKDTARMWDQRAETAGSASDAIKATAKAQDDWNEQLRDTIKLLDQVGGFGATLGDIGRVLDTLSTGNLSALPGAAGVLGKTIGGIQWVTTDGDGNRMVRQLGDEFSGVLDKVFGGSDSFTKALEGAGIGVAAGSAILGSGSSGLGSALGGALGEIAGKELGKGVSGILGSAMGPLGGVIGGVIGGALGSVFKRTTSGFAVVSNTGVTSGGNNSDLAAGAKASGNSLASALNNIADQLGGTIGNYAVSIGTRSSGWISVSGSGSTNVADKNWKKQNVGGDLIYDGRDASEAARVALLNAIQDGAVQGIREGAQRLLKAGSDLDRQLQKALDFEGVFSRLKAYTDPVGAALDTLNREFGRLKDVFAEAGANSTELADLEKLYGIERAKAVKGANDEIVGSMRDLYKQLTTGDTGLSLRDRKANAQGDYNALLTRVQAGDTTAYDDYVSIAQTLLGIEQEMSGSQSDYFALLSQVTAMTKGAIDAQDAISNAALASDSPFAVSTTTAAASDGSNVVSAISAQTTALIEALAAPLEQMNENQIATIRQLIANGQLAAATAYEGRSTYALAAGYW